MISMSPGAKLDASSGPEKGQLHICLAYLVCDDNAQSRRNRQCNSSIWPFTEAPKAKDASGITMKDWNVVITVNDSESFRKARREFQRFGDVKSTDYRNVLVLRVPDVPKFVQPGMPRVPAALPSWMTNSRTFADPSIFSNQHAKSFSSKSDQVASYPAAAK